MLARLYVIINSEKETDYQTVKDLLLKMIPTFSISPSRKYANKKGCSEFFVTANLEEDQVRPLLDQLDNNWDGEFDDCSCNSFNTKMFHELIDYLEFTLF